jgi:hypothetical protein
MKNQENKNLSTDNNFAYQPKKTNKFKGLIIAFVCLVLLSGGLYGWYWFNKPLFVAYYFNFKHNPFKPNDKMYINSFLVDESSAKDFKGYNISLYRLVRPLNDDEVDNMPIELAEKILIKKDLSSKKPYMTECAWSISTDSLCNIKALILEIIQNRKLLILIFLINFSRWFFMQYIPLKQL